LSSALEVCCGPVCITLTLPGDSPVVIGACVVWFKFYRACIIGNCTIAIVIRCSSVAAIVGGNGICGTEFDCPSVMCNRASGVLFQASGLSPVIIWRVVFWIELHRTVKIGDSAVQVTVLCFLNAAIN